MNLKRYALVMIGSACALVLFGNKADHVLAVQKPVREQAQAASPQKSSQLEPERPKKSRTLSARQLGARIGSERQLGIISPGRKQISSETKPARAKGRQRMNLRKKKVLSPATKPPIGIRDHGVLMDARRYDPSPRSGKGGISNPLTEEIRHDHFQELDRNRDGVIDPLERAIGRLDIERDMSDQR